MVVFILAPEAQYLPRLQKTKQKQKIKNGEWRSAAPRMLRTAEHGVSNHGMNSFITC